MFDATDHQDTRRTFLRRSGALIGAAALLAPAAWLGCAGPQDPAAVTATEALMREHGVLRRLLMIFEEMARRLKCCQEAPAGALPDAAALTRTFVQEHHEKLEENYLFPRMETAGKMVALVKILRRQHEAARQVTDYLIGQAAPTTTKNFVQRAQLEAYLNHFTRMYRVHAAREDTVLLPAWRGVVAPAEFAAWGKKFAELEQAKFGPQGYEKILAQVTDLEKALGLYDLEEFTPKI